METEVHFSQRQPSIAHVATLSEEGWVLKWGDSDQTIFEVVCRTENTTQVAQLETLLSDGHYKAIAQLV